MIFLYLLLDGCHTYKISNACITPFLASMDFHLGFLDWLVCMDFFGSRSARSELFNIDFFCHADVLIKRIPK